VVGRTDIVNYYTPWLLKRLDEGYAYSRNPFAREQVYKLSLKPEDVDCLLFCSKNYQPILKHISDIDEKYHILCNYTITAYGKDIEPKVPTIDQSIKTLERLSDIVGANKILWRYDPILLTEKYTVEKHLETFEYMAERISPLVYRCIFSFVDMYKKVEENMPEIIPLTDEDKVNLLEGIGEISKKYNLYIQSCATNESYEKYNIHTAGCTTREILEQAHNVVYKNVKGTGIRENCHCIPSRDIGAYNSCLSECKYCYANRKPEIPKNVIKLHDEKSPLLLGHLKENDNLIDTEVIRYIEPKQSTLFDF
jgi:DNA repair photolyase